jgi:phosphatidylglycerophosphatase A
MRDTENPRNRANQPRSLPLLIRCIGTFFFSGYTPAAPGTAGSLLALVPLLLFPTISTATLSAMIAAGFILGVWASQRFELVYGDDPQMVVIDEAVGMWTTMLLVPVTWFTALAGFILFRLFDIVKPPPARQLEAVPHGWGVMLDDLAAGIYAGAVLFLLHLLMR